MIEPITVWMVHLGVGPDPPETRGTLTLGDRGLEFVARKTATVEVFDYETIRRAKRIRGSPVLLIDWRDRGVDRKTAFYFSQPPPLAPVAGTAPLEPRGPLGALSRTTPSKRQIARMNLGYLRSTSVASRSTVRAWAQAVEERMRRAGGSA
ncbi:MAG TPA: hypothetical protein VFZ75_05670 [Actinomycetota bacterium]|nr:hypothetical protein [Actinomycetota bacterium]